MLLWETSGRGKFAELNNILIRNTDGNNCELLQRNTNKEKVNKIFKEKVNNSDIKEIITKFLKKLCNKKKLITCVSCGEKRFPM